MSEQVEMEEEDRGSVVTSTNQGEKKRFEVKKVLNYLESYFLLIN